MSSTSDKPIGVLDEGVGKLARGGYTGGPIEMSPHDREILRGVIHQGSFTPFSPARNPTPGEVIRTRQELGTDLYQLIEESSLTLEEGRTLAEYLIENDLLSENAYAEFGVKE